MALTKEQKKKILEDLREKIAKQKAMILVGIASLKVKDISDLKKKLKTADSKFQVVKKTLAEIVLKESKLDFDKKKFKEEIALIFCLKDELSPAKIIYQFSKERGNLKILGGFIENSFKTREEIISLAQLPTRDELVARLFAVTNYVSKLNSILERNLSILYQAQKVKT